MTYKYLIFSGYSVWGKHIMTKEYFANAAQRGDLIIDTEENTFFDKDTNSWQPLESDDK